MKFKRITALFMAVVLAVTALPVVASANSCANGHSFSSTPTQQAATCTAAGWIRRYCTRSGCSAFSHVATLNALGHSFSSTPTQQAATCVAAGWIRRYCTRSGCSAFSPVSTLNALGHNYSHVLVGRTCTSNGLNKCSRCAATDVTFAHGHNLESVPREQQPTCTAAGWRRRYCMISSCSHFDPIATLNPLNHNHTIEIEPATCISNGKNKCSRCPDTAPTPLSNNHSYNAYGVCMRGVSCGHIQNRMIFEHFMYREGLNGFANFLLTDHSIPGMQFDVTQGIDISNAYGVTVGNTIYAQGAGIIIYKNSAHEHCPIAGFYVVVRYFNGYTARYTHLVSPSTASGNVTAATPIGFTGSSGNANEYHLHFDVNKEGYWLGVQIHNDPSSVIRARSTLPYSIFWRF